MDVEELCELFGGEGLGRTEGRVSGVVNDDVEATFLAYDLMNCTVHGLRRRDIQFDYSQIDFELRGKPSRRSDLPRVLSLRVAYAGINDMTGLR
jgi:hypothetical protein